MAETIKPRTAAEVLDAVAWAASSETPLELIGRGSKRALGRPFQAAYALDLSDLKGIGAYEPEELVMTALPGTPLAEIERAVAERRQMLAFEPMDLGPLLGVPAGSGSIGGVFAANLSGPRRIKAGAARDHLLGFHGVSGRGEAYKAGGRVVKNVTGYDLAKLITGSFGTLSALTEITFKVLPLPEKARTVLVLGLDDARAIQAMTEALASPHEVASAAHLPAALAGGSAVSAPSLPAQNRYGGSRFRPAPVLAWWPRSPPRFLRGPSLIGAAVSCGWRSARPQRPRAMPAPAWSGARSPPPADTQP